jgi:penicillin-binding protein 1A
VRVLDRNGELLAERGPRYGERVEAGELPAHLIYAVIATEDRRFWNHDGVDRRGLARALIANWRAGRVVQGGSTITQQLVKNLFLTSEQTLKRKLQEVRLARELERQLSKPEILTLYLNRQYFGGRAYGVDAAARRYFGKPAREVTLSEAAMLAGLLKAPSRLDPSRNIADAQARARVVLAAMRAEDYITAEQEVEAGEHPATLLNAADEDDIAAYGYVVDVATDELRSLLSIVDPDLVIRTTIDVPLQQEAERLIETALAEQGEALDVDQGALLAMDPGGAVRALVGGRSYADSKFNRVTQALRQPGSAFKPIVFAAALEAGIRPSDVYVDEPIAIGNWRPTNYGGGYQGRMTVREAFKLSINTIAALIVRDIGETRVIALAHKFGVPQAMEPVPSIALGSQVVTLWHLTSAYAVFLNDGDYNPPYLIEQVTNTRGDTLYARPQFEPQGVYDPILAREIRGMLSDVVNDPGRNGRGRGTGANARLQSVAVDVAGKTGTSQDWRDAWFVGFSSSMVAGVWFGNDDDSPMNEVAGGGLPADLWRQFMEFAHAESESTAPIDVPERTAATPREGDLSSFYGSLARRFDRAAGG